MRQIQENDLYFSDHKPFVSVPDTPDTRLHETLHTRCQSMLKQFDHQDTPLHDRTYKISYKLQVSGYFGRNFVGPKCPVRFSLYAAPQCSCGINFLILFMFHVSCLSHCSPLSSCSNPSPAVSLSHGVFHSRIKTYFLTKSFPPQLLCL